MAQASTAVARAAILAITVNSQSTTATGNLEFAAQLLYNQFESISCNIDRQSSENSKY